jgi:hypothetical protein
MQRLEVGKLYSCSEYFLLLYPDKETAAIAVINGCSAVASDEVEPPVGAVAYWTRELGKPVIYAEKNISLLVLNTEGEYVEVLAGDQRGWAICPDWLELKDISCP